MTLLAETLISGEWVTGLILGVIGAVGSALVAYKKGVSAASETRLMSPVPTVPTTKVTTPPSWDAHRALCDRVSRTEADMLRVEGEMKDLRSTQTYQFQSLMAAGADREERIANKIDGFAKAIHRRIDEILTTTPPKRTR